MTLDQLKPQLVAAGVDVDQLRNVALRQLDPADQAAVNTFIQGPVAVSYLLTSDVQLLVYPATGTIVSVRQVTQSLAMRPDIAGACGSCRSSPRPSTQARRPSPPPQPY